MYAIKQVYTSDITTGPKDDPYTVRNAITLNIQINSPDFDQGEVCKRAKELCRAAMQYFESIQTSEVKG